MCLRQKCPVEIGGIGTEPRDQKSLVYLVRSPIFYPNPSGFTITVWPTHTHSSYDADVRSGVFFFFTLSYLLL